MYWQVLIKPADVKIFTLFSSWSTSADDEGKDFPLAAQVLKNFIYIYDIVIGASSLELPQHLQ